MRMQIERANAKINLYLDVVSKRPNGYHDLVSVMHTVSLCDLVSVSFTEQEKTVIELSVSNNPRVPTDSKNLAWKAAERYLLAAGLSGIVRIRIEKNIPMEAGLAGGSADAAAVLRALNRACKNALTTDELCRLGAGLGADVPFCIVGGAALVTGIGDVMESADCMSRTPVVIACMGEGVSTVWAYGRLDEEHGSFAVPKSGEGRARDLINCLREERLAAAGDCCFNLFEEVVPAERPCVTLLKNTLSENGAIRAMMSGSGPSVFGLFSDASDAERAANALRELGAFATVCYPSAEYEL